MIRHMIPNIRLSDSNGTKRVYAVKGYRNVGYIIGFNTRWGGYSLWVGAPSPNN